MRARLIEIGALLLCVIVLAAWPAYAQPEPTTSDAARATLRKMLGLPSSKPEAAKSTEKPASKPAPAPAPIAPSETPTVTQAPSPLPEVTVSAPAPTVKQRVVSAARSWATKKATGWARQKLAAAREKARTAVLNGAIASPEFGVPAPLFSGYHVGLSAGYGGKGAIGGGQAGYTLRFGRLAAGLEGDFSGLSGGQVDWLATTRARVGYVVLPNLLVYGTGGAAFGPAQSWIGGPKTARVGWTAGGGLEYAVFGGPVSLKAEYLHYDLGVRTVDVPELVRNNAIVFGQPVTGPRSWGGVVRLGVNYRFGGAADFLAPQ